MDNNTQSLKPYKTRSLNARCPTQVTQVSNQILKPNFKASSAHHWKFKKCLHQISKKKQT